MSDPVGENEARRIRRRWLTLGELLAVAGVLISALALWNSWSERRSGETEKQQEAVAASARSARLLLKASVSGDADTLTMVPLADDQTIQGQTIAFPAALGLSPVTTTGDARIESAWLHDGLKKARKAAGRKDESVGDERLPVAIDTRFLADGAIRTDHALYDVGYAVEGGGLFGGTRVRLRGLSLVSRSSKPVAPVALDRRWKAGG